MTRSEEMVASLRACIETIQSPAVRRAIDGDDERPLRAMIADVVDATPAKTRSAKKRRARRQDRKR